MSASIEEIVSAPWFSTLISVTGLLAGLIFYLKSRKVSRLLYVASSYSIVGSQRSLFPNELSISFAGVVIERVSLTTIVIWNGGDTTLSGSEIVISDPIRVICGSGRMLRVRIDRTSRVVNGFSVVQRLENEANLIFDFIDPGDGARVEIIHSGTPNCISLSGTLKGLSEKSIRDVSPFISDLDLPQNQGMRKTLRGLALVLTLLSTFIVYTGISGLHQSPKVVGKLIEHIDRLSRIYYLFNIFFGVFAIATSSVLVYVMRRRYPLSLAYAGSRNLSSSDGVMRMVRILLNMVWM